MCNWNKHRWNWKRAVKRDPRLSDAAKLLAVSLVDDFANHQTARCTMRIETLAECHGKSKRSIQRALSELRNLSWIEVNHRRGPGAKSKIVFLDGDGIVPVSSPEKVAELAAYRENKTTDVSFYGNEKATDMTQIDDNRVTPYIEPNKNQNGYAHEGAPAREDGPPVSQDASDPSTRHSVNDAPAPSATPAPTARPAPHLRAIVPHGSEHERQWNDWLRAKGLPELSAFAESLTEQGLTGWDMPWKQPPSDDGYPPMLAKRFVAWRIEARRKFYHQPFRRTA
ncbi:helix-turn-helix domain-containing protein [Qingshengfaniella alkalisoli]|uniref:Helix-turn-helix domain-containing protein n=1 Tax=Qingshengfaniella alkalisoli TaxID=2599296 RepID=A0A5B8IYN6_9RHOB|nr:helix-turn-helix domain-containing protein [Qingshengfaniella alkalisoli]QDY70011.1 helix-turn-helix domain-containing protein [Qingshengfaniella alkalisoli]